MITSRQNSIIKNHNINIYISHINQLYNIYNIISSTFIIWPFAFTLPTTFRGAGDAKWPMVVSLLVMFVCRIGLAYVISDFFGWGVFGTWVAMFIDWDVRAILFIDRYLNGKWMEYRAVGQNY